MPEPPPSAPVPISAEWESRTQRFVVVFDQLLAPGSLVLENWLFVVQASKWTTEDATAALFSVKGGARSPVPSPGGPWVSYLATPPDLEGQTGVPVAPFSEFPVNVI